jgi:hypothetical protein
MFPLILNLKNVIGEGLEGIEVTKDGKTGIAYERIEELISRKFWESGHLQEWGKRIETLGEAAAVENLTEMKKGTDPLAMKEVKDPIKIAHQFDGNRLHVLPLP